MGRSPSTAAELLSLISLFIQSTRFVILAFFLSLLKRRRATSFLPFSFWLMSLWKEIEWLIKSWLIKLIKKKELIKIIDLMKKEWKEREEMGSRRQTYNPLSVILNWKFKWRSGWVKLFSPFHSVKMEKEFYERCAWMV